MHNGAHFHYTGDCGKWITVGSGLLSEMDYRSKWIFSTRKWIMQQLEVGMEKNICKIARMICNKEVALALPQPPPAREQSYSSWIFLTFFRAHNQPVHSGVHIGAKRPVAHRLRGKSSRSPAAGAIYAPVLSRSAGHQRPPVRPTPTAVVQHANAAQLCLHDHLRRRRIATLPGLAPAAAPQISTAFAVTSSDSAATASGASGPACTAARL